MKIDSEVIKEMQKNKKVKLAVGDIAIVGSVEDCTFNHFFLVVKDDSSEKFKYVNLATNEIVDVVYDTLEIMQKANSDDTILTAELVITGLKPAEVV